MNTKLTIAFVFMLFVSMGFVLAAQAGNQVINVNSNVGEQAQAENRSQVQTGEHLGINGKKFSIKSQANNRFRIEAGNISAECKCNMTQEQNQEKTQLFAKMSNGKQAEVKIMPDVASETALKRLKLKVCSEKNNCTIELKEVGKNEKAQMAYELQTQRKAKVFGLFKAQMKVSSQVSAENGEVIKVKKPWWAFIASEPAEE